MSFDSKSLVFSLEIKATKTQAALQLNDKAQAFEAVFDCGRTNATPGRLDAYQPNLEELKGALRKTLAELEK